MKFHLRAGALLLAFLAFCPQAIAATEEEVRDQIEQVLGQADDLAEPMLSVQQAIIDGDADLLSGYVEFPLRVNSDGDAEEIADADALSENFSEIFTPSVRKAIKGMKYEELIVTSEGVGMANGAVWMSLICEDSECGSAHWAMISVNK